MTAGSDCLVCVFAKAPEPGSVKTRLVPLLGARGAAEFHAQCVVHALAVSAAAGVGPVELCCAPDARHPFFAACAKEHGVALTQQVDGDLGQRMHCAIAEGLAKHDSVVLIGADCPVLGPHDLRAAAAALLAGTDAVFAPAEDGGYVLVGTRRAAAALFADVAWSTASVMEETRANLRRLGWTWRELATQWDVDRPEDYRRLVGSMPEWIETSRPGADAARGKAP